MSDMYLEHHGIKGMKWGVRRYQNYDGSLTSAGKRRASIVSSEKNKMVEQLKKTRGINPSHELPKHLKDSTRSLTSAEDNQRNKKVAKVGAGVAAVATVSAAAYYVHKHPEKIGKVMSQFKGTKVSSLSQKAVDKGKAYVKQAIKDAKDDVKSGIKGAKDGFREGVREAPKKAAKAVVTGVVLHQTKKALDSAVGKEESAIIFQANDNKKIGKFWKVSSEDKDEED